MSQSVFDPTVQFEPDAPLKVALSRHGAGCRCALHSRRLFAGALAAGLTTSALPILAQGVRIDRQSNLAMLVPAEEIEAASSQQYREMLQQAAKQGALAPAEHPQVQRLRAIAQRLVPFSNEPNLNSTPRARRWNWEVNLIGSAQINAFCMPGGKIAFYTGILQKLQLTDDEVAMVMGHEIAHALREHARERMGQTMATRGAIEIGAALLGLGSGGRYLADMGGQLLTMRFGRDDELEADKIGLDMSARAGYDPRAGITLWEKMAQSSQGGGSLEWLSTHPSGGSRIRDIQANLPAVMPLYERADRPQRRYGPPSRG